MPVKYLITIEIVLYIDQLINKDMGIETIIKNEIFKLAKAYV